MGILLVHCHAIWAQEYPCHLFAVFKKFIHNFLEVYFDDWTIFGLVKNHVSKMRMMLDACRKHHISLNIKKCIFCIPFGILLGHIVCQQGLMVDPAKVALIINLAIPATEKQLRSSLGHTSYYRKFIQGYALITPPMEKLLKKDASFFWDVECYKSFELLKEKNEKAGG